MTVSALIPTYNRRRHIFRAIDSILGQTVPVNEILVVDDGSTDGSAEAILDRYGHKVHLVRQENTGVSGARLRAIQEASGEWIAFLDSDDEWLPNRNRDFLEALAHIPPDVAWIFGDMQLITHEGRSVTFFHKEGLSLSDSPSTFRDALTILYPVQHAWLQGSLIRRRVLIEEGCFTAGLRTHEDRLAAFQVARNHRFAAISSIVTNVYRTPDLLTTSLTHNGVNTRDHYLALILIYSLLIEATGNRTQWAKHYAGAVRGLCKLNTTGTAGMLETAAQQFRYGFSWKAAAFLLMAIFGGSGLSAWQRACKVTGTVDKSLKTLRGSLFHNIAINQLSRKSRP